MQPRIHTRTGKFLRDFKTCLEGEKSPKNYQDEIKNRSDNEEILFGQTCIDATNANNVTNDLMQNNKYDYELSS